MIKTWKVTLKPVTPIHVGDGSILEPTEYIAKNGYIYYLNQITLISDLLRSQHNTLKQALNSMELENIVSILADKFDEKNTHHWKSRTPVSANFCNLWKENLKKIKNSQQLHRFIRNQLNDQPFIPGSSLKGSIRTAVLSILSNDENKRKQIELAQAQQNRKFKPQTAEAILLNAQNNRGNFDVASDPFKYIKVSDAVFKDEQLFIDRILRFGMSENELPVYYEMLKPDSGRIDFKLSIDTRFSSITKDLVYNINYFYKKLANQELKWLQTNLKNETLEFRKAFVECANSAKTSENTSLIRLGFGSGQWSLTMHNYWKDVLKTKAIWNNQLLGWATLHFKETS
jgi:CRISPR-associated protein Csm5